MQIIFGTRRLGVSDIAQTNEKYPEVAVVTIEPSKEGGKSRRVLFNKTAASLLSLEEGAVQNITFGTVVIAADGFKQVLIANRDLLDTNEDLTTYKTSKNRVSFEGTKEKGKAISSSAISGQISSFLGLNEDVTNEFRVNAFDAGGIESYSLDLIVDNNVAAEPVLENVEAQLEEATIVESNDEVEAPVESGLPQRNQNAVVEPVLAGDSVGDWN